MLSNVRAGYLIVMPQYLCVVCILITMEIKLANFCFLFLSARR